MAESLELPPPDPCEIVYTDAGGIVYDWNDFIHAAKGNQKYAAALLERVSWQSPYTVVDEDIRCGEVVVFNDQIIMLNQDKQNAQKFLDKVREALSSS